MDDSKHKFIGDKELHPESLMMSYGYRPEWSEGALKPPIFQTSTFAFRSAEEGKAFFESALGLESGKLSGQIGLIYSRLNNPDLEVLEDRLTLWDRAESCAVFESGMAAISTVLLELLRPGNVILHSEPLYGGTDYLFKHVLTRFGIERVGFKAGASVDAAEKALIDSGLSDKLGVIFVETPANPTNALIDISALAKLASKYSKEQEVVLAVDNTFLGPLWQHPLQHGADLVLYSATKFIGGHSDVIAGVCLGSNQLMDRIRMLRTFLGTMAGPWSGWLIMRSLETLKLRMTCQMKNARYVADFLVDHPKVEQVYYLGLLDEEDPMFKVYRKQCSSPGSMISFDIVGGEAEAFRFLNSLKLFKLAVSLGSTESLAEHPATMTHADVDPAERQGMGISEKMVRLSIGVEHPNDLILDLEQALNSA